MQRLPVEKGSDTLRKRDEHERGNEHGRIEQVVAAEARSGKIHERPDESDFYPRPMEPESQKEQRNAGHAFKKARLPSTEAESPARTPFAPTFFA